MKAEDNQFPYLTLTEQAAAPDPPAAGDQRLYLKQSDHELYLVNSGGVERSAEAGGTAPEPPAVPETVYVETTGDNGTAEVGRVDLPFATINAALDALPAGGGVVRLGLGVFAPIACDALPSAGGINGATKLKNNVAFIGAKRPAVKADKTGLENGTIIQGPFICDRDGVQLYHLGVDSGSAVCTALYGGTQQEGVVFANIPQDGSNPHPGVVVEDVIAITKSKTATVHTVLIEHVIGARVNNVIAHYGFAGIVFKSVQSQAANLHAYDCGTAGLWLRSNPYAACHHVTIVNYIYTNTTGANVAAGIYLDAVSGEITDVTIVGVSITGADGGVSVNANANAVRRVRIDDVVFDAVTAEAGSAGTMDRVYVNGEALPAAGIAFTGLSFSGSWHNYGSGNVDAAYAKSNGVVYLRGLVVGGTVGSTIGTLPAGYRPGGQQRMAGVSHNGSAFVMAVISITSGGAITLESGGTSFVDLTSSFPV